MCPTRSAACLPVRRAHPRSHRALEHPSVATRLALALGHPLGAGPWHDDELEPYTTRLEWSPRQFGEFTATLGLTRTFCDSSAGPREIGAAASVVLEASDGRRVSYQWPPLHITGDPALLATLESAGLPQREP